MKNFRLNIILRVLLLLALVFLLFYALGEEGWYMTSAFAAAGILLSVLLLIRYVEKSNRDLQSFLLSVKYKDYTQVFSSSSGRGKSFQGLQMAFNTITGEFRQLRAEKDSHFQYLQNVVEHIGVALLCYDSEGEIELLNRAAKNLLQKPYLKNVHSLKRTHPKLYDQISSLKAGDRKLVKNLVQDELLFLAIQHTKFKLQNEEFTLVSLQNIQSELEEQEIESWQKLIRVLTHEIMNSVTPIISLSASLSEILDENEEQNYAEIDKEDMQDVQLGIKTILSRSEGMQHFVNAYRSLTRVPTPNFESLYISELFAHIQSLLQPELDKRSIQLKISMELPSQQIFADGNLLEQVMINLVKNAMEALGDKANAQIVLESLRINERNIIRVKDNGPGIPEEYLQQIFIPFFTTKTIGSGIGLSLSRQIMRLHKGNISVQTDAKGTVFTLSL